MYRFQNRYLLYPLFFVIVLFLADKLFLLPEVRDSFIQPGGMLYYAQRKEQVRHFKAAAKGRSSSKKLAVILGDSRSFAIGDEMLLNAPNFEQWSLYNFSGPQAVPAYHYALAQKLLNGLDRPDFLILGLSLDVFNRNSGLFAHPNLNYGVDDAFIRQNQAYIPNKDKTLYINSRRYALTGLRFSLKTLLQRMRGSFFSDPNDFSGNPAIALQQQQTMLGASTENLALYSLRNSPKRKILDQTHGAQYAWFGSMGSDALQKETARLVALYHKSFMVSSEQLYFFQELLELAQNARVKTLVFLPQVNPFLIEVYKQEPKILDLKERIEKATIAADGIFRDLNEVESVRCEHFYDASHLSINCFPAITRFLLRQFSDVP